MTLDTIITQFELQVSDTTELSSTEEVIVANRVYTYICNQRPWQFLKTSASGTISSDTNGSYITAPSDFAYFLANNTYTDNSATIYNNTDAKVIFIGSNYTPYQIINWSDRRQYRNKSGYAYYDAPNGVIRFTAMPQGNTYEFDYIMNPTALTVADSPIFPARFHDIIVYGMAVDDQIIQLSPKATSYAAENQMKYNTLLAQMKMWDANLQMM